MKERILEDLKNAMKNQDKETLSTIRLLKGALQLEEINKKGELTDDEIIGIVSKQIKTRKESIAEFEKAGRTDLADKTKAEVVILEKYLPEQLDISEVNRIIDEAFNKVNPTSMKDMKDIMAYVNPLLKGKADMGYVSKTIKDRLI
jgi:uncharacterized protein YqeY